MSDRTIVLELTPFEAERVMDALLFVSVRIKQIADSVDGNEEARVWLDYADATDGVVGRLHDARKGVGDHVSRG